MALLVEQVFTPGHLVDTVLPGGVHLGVEPSLTENAVGDGGTEDGERSHQCDNPRYAGHVSLLRKAQRGSRAQSSRRPECASTVMVHFAADCGGRFGSACRNGPVECIVDEEQRCQKERSDHQKQDVTGRHLRSPALPVANVAGTSGSSHPKLS